MSRIGLFFPLLCLVAACKSSDEDEEQGLFNTYPEPVQKMIRAQTIDLTFDTEQVRMAWGRPDKTRRTRDGETEWLYTKLAYRSFERKKDPAVYEKERLIYEGKVESGERVTEPQPVETVYQYRTRIWRVATFRDGSVVGWRQPEDEFVDDWTTSEVS